MLEKILFLQQIIQKKWLRLSRNPHRRTDIYCISFFSPVSNLRKDEFGGSLKNRCKFLIEIAKDVRKVWPKNKILGARITGYDWLDKKDQV